MSTDHININMNSSLTHNLREIFKCLASYKPGVYTYDAKKRRYPNIRVTKLLEWADAQLLGNLEDLQGTLKKIHAACPDDASEITVRTQYMGYIRAYWNDLIDRTNIEIPLAILQLYGFPDVATAKACSKTLNQFCRAVEDDAAVRRATNTFSTKDQAAIGNQERSVYLDDIKAKVLEAMTMLANSMNTTRFEYGTHLGLLSRLFDKDRRSADYALRYQGSTSEPLILIDEHGERVYHYFPQLKDLVDVHTEDMDKNVIRFKIDYKKRFSLSPLNKSASDAGFFYVDSKGKPFTRDNWCKMLRKCVQRVCSDNSLNQPTLALLRRLQITEEEPHNMSQIEREQSARAHGHSAATTLTYNRHRDVRPGDNDCCSSSSGSSTSSKRAKTYSKAGIVHSASRSDTTSVSSLSFEEDATPMSLELQVAQLREEVKRLRTHVLTPEYNEEDNETKSQITIEDEEDEVDEELELIEEEEEEQ
ncbi:hypothetical protein DFJ77DRAFT_515121 [Powellomyces hirtus]|nr:hypothetical protein DFJ77DRAFT_515121 [Powellomyces hirtus]